MSNSQTTRPEDKKLGRQAGKIYCCNWPDTGICNCVTNLHNFANLEEQKKDDVLQIAILIVERCRKEGREDCKLGLKYSTCPYEEEIEKAAWLDGWSKQNAGK